MMWVEGIGKLFLFLSFWFAAPEILGEEKLRRYTKSGVLVIVFGLAVVAWLAIMVWLGSDGGFNQDTIRRHDPTKGPVADRIGNKLLLLVLAGIGLLGIVLATAVGISIFSGLMRLIDKYLFAKLVQNDDMRRFSFIIGAFMFVIGSGLDFIAWFISKS